MNAAALLPLPLFAALAGVAGLLALVAPLHWLLMLDLVLVALPGQWRVSSTWVDPADLVCAGLFAGLLLRGRGLSFLTGSGDTQAMPKRWLWLALGVLLCVAYVTVPEHKEYMTSSVRVTYQLYRYCWKSILYFPFALLLLRERPRAEAVLAAAVVGADLCALQALPQGYHGLRAMGPFGSPNTLGAVLVVPLVICVAWVLAGGSRWRWLFAAASTLLIGRALLFSQSRGALMAVVLGTCVVMWQLFRQETGRKRLLRLAPWVLAAACLALVLKPGLSERPNVARFLTLGHATDEDTFQWRLKQRWPHFWAKAMTHPMLGVGTEVDTSLGTSANTPHNGFIAIAVISGLPSLAIYLIFAAAALRAAVRHLRRGGVVGADALLTIIAMAGLIGLLVHNVDDTILVIPFIAKLFWLLTALALAPPVLAAAEARASARAPESIRAQARVPETARAAPEAAAS